MIKRSENKSDEKEILKKQQNKINEKQSVFSGCVRTVQD